MKALDEFILMALFVLLLKRVNLPKSVTTQVKVLDESILMVLCLLCKVWVIFCFLLLFFLGGGGIERVELWRSVWWTSNSYRDIIGHDFLAVFSLGLDRSDQHCPLLKSSL